MEGQILSVRDSFLGSMKGEKIAFICHGHTYIGKPVLSDSLYLKIEGAEIIYEEDERKHDQAFSHAIYLQISAIQSFWIVK